MTYEEHAASFASIINITWQSCKRNPPDKPTKAYWFDKLKQYEFTAVENAFDQWLKSQDELPTIHQIITLCQHKVTIAPRLNSPLAIEDNKRHIKDVVDYVAKHVKPKTDYKAWAKKIITNPKNYPDISLKYAKEALRAE